MSNVKGSKRTSNKTNGLPPIKTCRFCSAKVVYVDNSAIYGTSYGKWSMAYLCTGCRAYVGTHPGTNIPLGTIANNATREARKRAHSAFDHIWKGGHMKRTEAYEWLAGKLGIAADECHIGLFEVERCAAVCIHSRNYLGGAK